MKILLLAPHPFYQDRGTPIAVDLVLKVLSERGDHVDVLTFHEGRDVHYPNVDLYRIPAWHFLNNIRPGFSWKKLICDGLMFGKVLGLLLKNRYHLVHAVEESAFIALVVKRLFKIPYLYDMDSSLSQQIIEKFPRMAWLSKVLMLCERQVVQNACVVMPVCEALAQGIKSYRPTKIMILEDVPFFNESEEIPSSVKDDVAIPGIRILYVGNLESYQGIDLLLTSFALAIKQVNQATLLIVGGEKDDRDKYFRQACELGIDGNVRFLGPRPLHQLSAYLSQADILVSPRVKGKNTPMKLYSYLASGRAILATNLATHTQVIHRDVALLADPTSESFAKGMIQLIEDEALRKRLGISAKELVENKYSFAAYKAKLNAVYHFLEDIVGKSHVFF